MVKEEAYKEQNKNIKTSETHHGVRDKGKEKKLINPEISKVYQSSKKLHCKHKKIPIWKGRYGK